MKKIKTTYLLILGMLLLAWFSYSFAFSKTLESKKTFRKLKEQASHFNNIQQQLQQLNVQKKYYDSVLKVKNIEKSYAFETTLLNSITSLAKKLQIEVADFNEPHYISIENNTFKTYQFLLIGSYTATLQLINNLEQHQKLGKIISVRFITKKHKKTYKPYLECTIHLQTVEQLN